MEKQMTVVNNKPMMGSRKIAVVVGKDHGKVCRDIRVMLGKLYSLSEEECTRNPDLAYLTNHGVTCVQYDLNNPNAWEYWLDHEHSECLVTGYDAARRMALIKSWKELNAELTQPRIVAPAQQAISTSDHILSVARVVAEATASATMKAVMDVIGQQVIHSPALPTPEAALITAPEIHHQESEFVPVIDLVWKFGLSDAACRRLASYSNLPTKLTNGERGYLLVHNVAFSEAFSCLIEESTQPTGKLKRWQHPDFGGFALKITEANKAAVEAKQ
ncbi:Rha family transcriptional regulator [Serratia fonticola]|uniref:Rha family transcriptional regulator n=1 Tax=Serratia fonticola TaxID=47917 RepID=UPI003AAF963B